MGEAVAEFTRRLRLERALVMRTHQPDRTQRRDELNDLMAAAGATQRLVQLPVGESPDGFEVTIRRLPLRAVAVIRVLNPF